MSSSHCRAGHTSLMMGMHDIIIQTTVVFRVGDFCGHRKCLVNCGLPINLSQVVARCWYGSVIWFKRLCRIYVIEG